jgi:hypothetical protein
MIDIDELKSALSNFSGCDTFTRWSILSKDVATEGVIFLAEKADCFWLLDLISSHQLDPKVKREELQVWKLTGTPGGAAVVVCENGNGKEVTRQELEYNTFPLPEIAIWATVNAIGSRTLMLPSEY